MSARRGLERHPPAHRAQAATGRRPPDQGRPVIDVVAHGARMDPEEAYMLLSIIGELRIGTSPRPVMAARLIIPLETLAAAGWTSPW